MLPFVRRAVGPVRLGAGLVRSSHRLVAAALDSHRRDAAKAALVRHTLTGYDETALERVALQFADDVRASHLRADVVERLDWHRGQGHETVVVSASFRDYLEPVARALGIDAVLATELEVRAGRLTGRLVGANVRGRGEGPPPRRVARSRRRGAVGVRRQQRRRRAARPRRPPDRV